MKLSEPTSCLYDYLVFFVCLCFFFFFNRLLSVVAVFFTCFVMRKKKILNPPAVLRKRQMSQPDSWEAGVDRLSVSKPIHIYKKKTRKNTLGPHA